MRITFEVHKIYCTASASMFRYHVLLFFVFMPTCSFAQRGYYIPKALPIPLHEQKQQVQVAAGWGGGYGLDVSYAATNHLAFFSTATLDQRTYTRTRLFGGLYKQYNDNFALQGGVGYFSQTKYRRLNWVEWYAGAGVTNVNNSQHSVDFPEDEECIKARYWTTFSQLNIGKKGVKGELVFGVRLAYSRYLDFTYYDAYQRGLSYQYENLQGITLEPVISYGYRWKGFKAAIQGGFAAPLFAPKARLRTTQPTAATPVITVLREQMPLAALIGRISLHYRLDLRKKEDRLSVL